MCCVCVCVFIKLHITAQSGLVILVILCHCVDPPKGGSMILVTKISDQTRHVCVFFPFNLDVRIVGRTSRGRTGGRSHWISRPPFSCGACLNFSREKDSAVLFPLGL